MVQVKEGDRVQYVIELGSEKVYEGVVQKVLRGGESLEKEYPSIQSKPRYIIEDENKHTYETFSEDHLIKKN